MKNINSKIICEWAMMLAVTVVLILLTWYVPLFSIVGMFVCGVPMACLASKNGWKIMIVALVGVFAVTFLVTGNWMSAAYMMLTSIIPGIVAGACLGKGINFFTTLFITCLAVCIGWLFEIFVLDTLIGGNGMEALFNEAIVQFKQTFELAVKNLPKEAKTAEIEKIINYAVEMMIYVFRLYLPSIIVISSMVIGYIILRFCGFFIKRLKIKDIYAVPFSMLKAPRSMTFAAVLLYVISAFSDKDGSFWAVCANVVLILYTIIGICGLSFLDSKFSKTVPKSGLRALIYVVVFLLGGAFMTIILNGLVIVGILDSSYNFRKISLDGKPTDGGDGGGWV